MTNIDQFESVFKAADKTPFSAERIRVDSVLVLSGDDDQLGQVLDRMAREFLASLEPAPRWLSLTGSEFDQVEGFVAQVEAAAPDLICTYRNLKTPAHDYPYSLGVFVEVLTQATSIPVMLLPAPSVLAGRTTSAKKRNNVMAITDHLTGDHHLVSFAAYFTESSGTLHLSHVEDAVTFERYIETIARIPAIDTDTARETIRHQLLKEPHDYIRSCQRALGRNQHLQISEVIRLGHQLTDYKELIEEHQIDLLVMNTKDAEQAAMHGLAYPLAVELQELPLLLL